MSRIYRLLAFTLAFVVVLSTGVALASHTANSAGVVSGFEIDGDFDFDGLPTATRDWDNVASTPDASGVTVIYDPPDSRASGPEFIFSNGSKENEPAKWSFNNQKPPSKADMTRAYLASEFSATKSSLWLAFERMDASGAGDVHGNFELNKSSETRTINGHVVPVRTPGTIEDPQDLLVVYDWSGGTGPVRIEVRTWTGTPLNGEWALINPPPTAAHGDVNGVQVTRPEAAPFFNGTVGARRFGEAGLDLKAIFGQDYSLCDQGGFKQFSLKSRSSGESFNSALKDYVGPTGIITCPQPQSALDKGVRVHKETDPQDAYTNSVNAQPGATIDYQVVYQNNGSANASNITVTDVIAEKQTYVANSCSGGDSCSYNAATRTVSWTIAGPVSGGSSVPLTFQVTLDATFSSPATITNQANGTADGEEPFTSDQTTITVTGSPSPAQTKGVRVHKAEDPQDAFAGSTTASPGDQLDYQVVYSNNGNADATGVTVTDVIEPRQTYVANSCSPNDANAAPGDAGTCSISGDTITWYLPTITPGSSYTMGFSVVLDATFPAGTTTVENTAVAHTPGVGDTPSNTTTTTVGAGPAPAQSKGVRVHKAQDPQDPFAGSTTAAPGDQLDYQVVYSNNGNAPATGVTVTDEIAAKQTYVADSCTPNDTNATPGDPGTCSISGNTITWYLPTINPGGSYTMGFSVILDSTFPAGTTSIENVAVAHTPNNPDTPSNTTTTTVNAAPAPAQTKGVRVHKAEDPQDPFTTTTTASPGDQIDYQIVYTNNGNSDATGVTVTDVIEAHQTYVADSCTPNDANATPGDPGTCSISGNTITWYLPTITPGSSYTMGFSVTLDSTFPTGTTEIKNTAVANTPGVGTTPSNETTVTVSGTPLLGLLKTASVASAAAGEQITYTLAYFNESGFDATGATITEEIPAGTAFVSCSNDCAGAPDGPITWTVDVAGNTSATNPAGTVTLTVTVLETAECQICNVATISVPAQNNGTPVNSNQVCVAVSGGDAGATSEAFGLYADVPLLSPSGPLIPPTPTTEDGDDTNDTLIEVPADPIAHARVLSVAKNSNVDETNAHASAIATTGEVKLLDTDSGDAEDWLVQATAIQAVSTSDASGETAGSTSAGSVLTGVQIGDENLGTVSEPVTKVLTVPGLGTVTVELLEHVGDGAAGEEPQPADELFTSGLTVNGIHVTVTDPLGNVVREIIVAHAASSAAFPSSIGCGEDAPQVSGNAYSTQINADETLVDPQNQLLFGEVGRVTLPSTGGQADSTLLTVGPLTDAGNTVLESNTARNHTEGTVDNTANTASASSWSEIQQVHALDQDAGTDEDFLVSADLVKAEAASSFDGTDATSTGSTTLVNLTLAGTEVCTALGLDDLGGNNVCTPRAEHGSARHPERRRGVQRANHGVG